MWEHSSQSHEAMVVVNMETQLVCCNARFRNEWLGGAPVGKEDPHIVRSAVRGLVSKGARQRELFFPLWGRAVIYAANESRES